MSASANDIAMSASTNDVTSTAQLQHQSVVIGITEFLLGCMEFVVGTDEADEPMKQNGAQAMHDGFGDVVTSVLGHEIDPARVNEQQQRISAVIVRLGITGVYARMFTKVRNAGGRIWNGAFGRAERALQE